MRKRLLALLALLMALSMILALSGCNSGNVSQVEQDPPQTTETTQGDSQGVTPGQDSRPVIHGLITRVEYGDNVAYIFGSLHSGRADWFPLSPIVEDAMSRADVFAFEIDMSLMGTQEVSDHLDSLILLPDGQTLQDVLSPESMDNFIEKIGTVPFLSDNAENFRELPLTPVAILMLVILPEITAHLDIESEYSVDDYVNTFALENDRPSIGLTSIFDELDLLYGVPMEIQATIFDGDTLADWETIIAALDDIALVEAYEAQDLVLLQNAFAASRDDSIYGQHFHNVNWNMRCHIFANEIARLLQETEEPTTYFVTVGISHIIGGDFGKVLEILENSGFEVTPLWS